MPSFCEATGVGVISRSPLGRGILSKPRSVATSSQSLGSASDIKTEEWFADSSLGIVDAVQQVA
ncbi:Aldo/keto reductase family [Geosmithia morbida]|uniref:Aldo/keto reductase family n=1 Tax=Geosmithia morbida TaxID=1094350 RepID=A0A9P5D1R1_9HYPO|nr:Aldo/keto reductase family [Geosmithia morbida]KAF4120050.1 Aldo/keto reductase family [Geosmithia morbida]